MLEALSADIAVLQECARPLAESESLLWFGDNPRQGLAVVARGDYKLRRVRRARSVPKYVIPVEVTGPRNFLLFAVWTKTNQEHCYVEAAVRAVYLYRKLIASATSSVSSASNASGADRCAVASRRTWSRPIAPASNASVVAGICRSARPFASSAFACAFGTRHRHATHGAAPLAPSGSP